MCKNRFPNLEAEQARKSVSDGEVAAHLGIARESYNRKKKNLGFTFLEVRSLCDYFEKQFDYLFATDETEAVPEQTATATA